MSQQSSLRQQLQAKRQALSRITRQKISQQVAATATTMRDFIEAKHIAFYYPIGAELDPSPLLTFAEKHGQCCYLPVITPGSQQLNFVRYQKGDELQSNSYHILEPKLSPNKLRAPRDLDLVFMPLVGFDAKGHRIGMGGGFYDVTFSFSEKNHKPLLIGLAFSIQQVPLIHPNPWDVPLDGVVTEEGILQF